MGMEISEWILEIFKGMIVRFDCKWGIDEGEEVENDFYIFGLGNWLNGRIIYWYRELSRKNRLGGKNR